jgi:hypothetical protein
MRVCYSDELQSLLMIFVQILAIFANFSPKLHLHKIATWAVKT